MWPVAEPNEPAWTVWREDDNGVRVVMAKFANAQAAAAIVAYYEQLPHKQTYWVENPPPGTTEDVSPS